MSLRCRYLNRPRFSVSSTKTGRSRSTRLLRVASLLKHWPLGNHHGGWRARHVETYLNQFIFRFNPRPSNARSLLVYRLVQNTVVMRKSTYEVIVLRPKSPDTKRADTKRTWPYCTSANTGPPRTTKGEAALTVRLLPGVLRVGGFVVLDELKIERLIRAAGYDSATPVAVGVSSASMAPVLATHGEGSTPTLDCDGVAYAGSLAKQITGACAALLAQNGTLDLEAPIADWLAELPRWSRTIRVRHLIHHTAGLPTTEAVWEQMTSAKESDWTSDGVLAALSMMYELEHQPGAAYAYSNVGYICLARILERLSGADLGTFAEKHLFEPLQMRVTTLWSGPAQSPPTAVLAEPLRSPAALSVGDGGLWTSVRDLLRWNEALLADTIGVAAALHTTGALDDGTPLDYAWGVRVFRVGGNRVESHGGSWEGATAKLVRLPDLGVSFAALAHDGSVERMAALSSSLQDELLGGTTL